MKKTVLIFASAVMILSSMQLGAQGRYGADSAQCIKYLSYYQEYYKSKQFKEALPNWREAYRICPPQASQNMLLNGMTMVRQLIGKNSSNKAYKAALIDTLMRLHSQRIEFYPKYSVSAYNSKGQDLFNYIKNDNERLHREFTEIIASNGEKTKASFFVYDYNAAVKLYGEGKLTADDLISLYQSHTAILSNIKTSSDFEADQVEKAKKELESRFIASNVAGCESLLKMYTPKLEANPEDVSLVKNIVKMLNVVDGCTDNDLYLKAVSSMYKLEPSYSSAYYLYRLNASRGNFDDAFKYVKEAIEFTESDARTDAEYSYEFATFCYKNGRNDLAFEYARKAASLDESQAGKSYFLIGNIWGATKCGGDEIAVRAPYWVAVDYMIKAKNADASLAEEASKYIAIYSKYYPQTADAFMYSLKDGDSYTVSCRGLVANTTVRTQK